MKQRAPASKAKDFAVVADEVRKLAERTTHATREIQETIQAIQSETGSAVSDMQAGTKQVAEGIALADQASQSLSNIVEESDGVSAYVGQIATAIEEQATTGAEVSQHVERISSVIGDYAISTREVARTTTELSSLAEDLRQVVAHFKVECEI